MSTTVRPITRTITRRLLPALLLALGALAANGGVQPLRAQLISVYKESGTGDGDGSGEASLATRICGYGKMQLCALETTKSCTQWGTRPKINITLTGFGLEYEMYCMVETTTTRHFYRDV